jgi:hypothetical protein
MLKRQVAFAMQRGFNDEGRGAGELEASLDNHGRNLRRETLSHPSRTASVNVWRA